MAWQGFDRCVHCSQPLEGCRCVCPYCGEGWACTCCIGYGRATGG